MPLRLPAVVAWRHHGLVDGFEVAFGGERTVHGHVTGLEDGQAYAVDYEIGVDDRWRSRSARVVTTTVAGTRTTVLAGDGEGRWTVDGAAAPQLDGLVDVDLEASALTNAFPVQRLRPAVGEPVPAPAVYVRVHEVVPSRLEQVYRRVDDHRFDYRSEGGFRAEIVYDDDGLVRAYPGIATRSA